MSLPLQTLYFYRLPDQAPAASTIAGLLDAIYTALRQSTDQYGQSVPNTYWCGTGVWDRYQNGGTTEAVYTTGTPTSTPMTRTPRIIFGGRSTIGTPTMLLDTATNSNLMMGMNLASGNFATWDSAAPFTSGPFSGFCRAAGTGANSTSTLVRCFVSQESVFINVIQAAATQYWLYGGAIIEPWTNDTTSDADSDNRLYGFTVSGAATCTYSNAMANATQCFLNHAAGSGSNHNHTFIPGTTTSGTAGLYTTVPNQTMGATATAAMLTTVSSAYVSQPWFMRRSAAPENQLGRMREVYMFGLKQGGTVYQVSSVNKAHVLATSNTSATEALTLRAI